MTRLLQRHDPAPRLSTRPYRDAAIVNGALAAVIVVVAWLASASVGRAALIAFGYFVAATGWVWWRLLERIRRSAEDEGS